MKHSPAPHAKSPRAQLLAATANLHQLVEDAVPLARTSLTLPVYRQLLPRFGALVEGHEAAIDRHAEQLRAVGVDWPAQQRWPLLARDLAALGLAQLTPVAVSYCDSLAHALGCLYVLSGSTLGGIIIGRNLRQTLGLDSDTGAAYFGGDRAAASAFRVLCEVLDRELGEPQLVAAAAEGARATFTAYHSLVTS